ncbi:MAG: putative aminohydrolase SsnA [Bacteroidales bacterium]
MSILLKNGVFIDWHTLEFTPADIFLADDQKRIQLFYPGEAPADDTTVLDCNGMFITRSFTNAHHHAYSALARGMPPVTPPPQNFQEILEKIWWRLDKAITREMIAISALVTAIESARAGVTFIIDHHSSPGQIEGSLETIANAFEKTGLSHLLCYEISDRNGTNNTRRAFAETEEWLQQQKALVGLHAAFTVSDATLSRAVRLADKYHTGIHIHVAEDKVDQEVCIINHGKRVVNRLAEAGVLNLQGTILAHCIHLSDEERSLIRNSESWIVTNCESNLNNGVGQFSSARLGDRIMLGTDGMHSDMIKALKASWFNQLRIDKRTPADMYHRLRNADRYLYELSITNPNDQNLVVFDYPSPTPVNADNWPAHLVFGVNNRHIRHVISNGQLIVRDYRITTVDEKAVYSEARNLAGKLWETLKG